MSNATNLISSDGNGTTADIFLRGPGESDPNNLAAFDATSDGDLADTLLEVMDTNGAARTLLGPAEQVDRDDSVMFSESAGRFIVTIDPKMREVFEKQFKGIACACIGTVTAAPQFEVKGIDQKTIISIAVDELKAAWKKPFGDLI